MLNNKIIEYSIDETIHKVTVDETLEFKYGSHNVISNINTDLTFEQPWYCEGYTVENFLTDIEFLNLYKGVESTVLKILQQKNVTTNGFTLEKYHTFVNDELHKQIVATTRELYPSDFNFSISCIIKKFEDILRVKLTDFDILTNQRLQLILRINRPQSSDFNPPHKDIYEPWDNQESLKFINIWIPVCGVNEQSSLPIVKKSHLLYEDSILRTFKGGIVNGNKYHVKIIKEWGGSSKLTRVSMKYGDVLFFSPCLIHGLAKNDQIDVTRVAFEFRLLPLS